ncbi:hypothetical protein [Pseudalkalibacillus caeni]|uniref:Uncharacterized protein n=1 Tax=Exobacillus caeni TaxID=2574798 RepID=A0A5R9F0J0_9BACL|nr:hypothetical protein [Pseudalkalibacillus caeni]TLS37142.1 hypothetical protein FCL54_11480 [Pseudalkalibacillus caeni]
MKIMYEMFASKWFGLPFILLLLVGDYDQRTLIDVLETVFYAFSFAAFISAIVNLSFIRMIEVLINKR